MDYEKKIREYMVSSKVDQLYKSMLINLFPELAEIEDERIRKELINFCKIAATGQSSILIEDANQFNRWAAWLEKQGEQKPILDVEIPFDAKDSELEEVSYNVPNGYHAKIEDNKVVIKKGGQKPTDKVEPKFKVGQTIKKEGFNLGFTIVKIEDCFYYNDMGDYFPFTDQDNWELVEQKPVEWSEEDEGKAALTIRYLEIAKNYQTSIGSNYIDGCIDWLKSLRPQNRWKPSEEQMKAFEYCIDNNCCDKDGVNGSKMVELYQQLKAL